MNNHKKVSKFLSFVLRHNPQSIDLSLDVNGWADIDELIEKSRDKIVFNKELIVEVVKNNDKQRFIIKNNKIRANQGHSIEVDLELKSVTPPDVLYHGTATKFIASIMKEGLSKQKRQHVHLSKDIQTATNVGQRHGKLVMLEVDAKKMFEEGVKFYLSHNGVWLTDSVGVKFLKEIRGILHNSKK